MGPRADGDARAAFAVRLHSAGLSLRETTAILDLLGVDRSHGAVWEWTHRLAAEQPDPPRCRPRRVVVDETAVQIGTEWCWCYAAIDLDSMIILEIEVFSRRGTDPAAAFLHRLTERHDLSNAELVVDSFGGGAEVFPDPLLPDFNYTQDVVFSLEHIENIMKSPPVYTTRSIRDQPNQTLRLLLHPLPPTVSAIEAFCLG